MKSIFRALALLMTSAMVCCNGEDTVPTSGNTNTNNAIMGISDTRSNGEIVTLGSVRAVTEGSTSLQQAANRIEIPRLQGGSDNLFVVHTVDNFGINYCIEWNYTLRAQRWSAFRWDKSNSITRTSRTNLWGEDPLIPSAYRTSQSDYSGSGYDRGHMMASQDRVNSYEANVQTFYYSNMHPQLRGFNGDGIWWNLENHLRSKYNTNKFRDTLYVVKGGTIGQGNYTMARKIPVPKYFFMAVLRKRNDISLNEGYAAVGFWMKHEANTDTDFEKYAVSIDKLEQLTGLDFFCNLPDAIENEVERSYSSVVWFGSNL